MVHELAFDHHLLESIKAIGDKPVYVVSRHQVGSCGVSSPGRPARLSGAVQLFK
jgi:hypothetical protein